MHKEELLAAEEPVNQGVRSQTVGDLTQAFRVKASDVVKANFPHSVLPWWS